MGPSRLRNPSPGRAMALAYRRSKRLVLELSHLQEELIRYGQELLQHAGNDKWSGDWQGMGNDVSIAIASSHRFREVSRTREGHLMLFDIEWMGREDHLAAIDRDFFRMYGEIAEETTFIRRTVHSDAVVYSAVLGGEDHGHLLRFRVAGRKVLKAIQGYEEAGGRVDRDA